ncbi:hypothetical protein GV819_19895 [Pseudomonas sp. Fl5BN2]|uniref:hypothetical protein n=1 Tax=unclassified Pseudomonas TaxID=196821 RepID=UPI001377089C|nr:MULTISPECIES: hypothetical protein [unclassified Pseudomonas]NBF04548.1 hypothetical protein [Pseudomonas sp. Fl5BN2]NBF11519.1 hypothetical protein [Pseudomonas sp. Fl4BN1]
MFTPNLHHKMIFVGFLLISSNLKADSFSGGTGWGKFAQALLAVSTCQDRLLETERAACFKRNARQACQYAPEGIEKDNCVKQYSGYPTRPDPDPSKKPSRTAGSLTTNHVPGVLAPFIGTEAKSQNSKPDEFDSRVRVLLYAPKPAQL